MLVGGSFLPHDTAFWEEKSLEHPLGQAGSLLGSVHRGNGRGWLGE